MSFIVVVTVKEGIVMASDSRISLSTYEYVNNGNNGEPIVIKETMAHYSDTAYKTFLMDDKIGISTCGNASINNEPISGYIEKFMRENKNCPIEEIPQKLCDYIHDLEPNKNTTFFVSGYAQIEGTELKQCLYRINTTLSLVDAIEEHDTSFPCAYWDGERDIASRLFTDLYIKEIDKDGKEVYTQHVLHDLASSYWTLQDAIEFAKFAIDATANSMKFQQRAKTVGGPIDILVIKPENAYWIQRKELHP